MRSLAFAVVLAAVLACPTILAAPAPFPKPVRPVKPLPNGPFEIDFTPLNAAPADADDWRLTVMMKGGWGSMRPYCLISHLSGSRQGTDEVMAHLLKWRLPEISISRDPSGKKLLVTPHKGAQIDSVHVKLENLHPALTPTVRRLPR